MYERWPAIRRLQTLTEQRASDRKLSLSESLRSRTKNQHKKTWSDAKSAKEEFQLHTTSAPNYILK